ncbi:MAG: hypothetical protein O9264_08375 [Leptospira sp.]|nr:hypothetical protein [Leptospira sp.]
MSKSYSGERVPGTISYKVFVTEGKQKRELLIDHRIDIKSRLTEIHLSQRDELAYRISFAILSDYTNNDQMSESICRDFKSNMERLFSEDHWLLHSNRIEALIQNENKREGKIEDFSFFSN